jgi:hypothetical protein
MNFKNMVNAVTSRVGRQVLVTQKHSPVILFTVGVVGMAATVVLASRATLKVDEKLQELEKRQAQIDAATENLEDYTPNDRRRDLAVVRARFIFDMTKLYGPALLTGVASIAALTGSHVVLNRRYLGVTAAYAALERGFDRYRKAVVDKFGDDVDKELRYDLVDRTIVEETSEGPVTSTVKRLGNKDVSIYACFFDQTSKNWNKEPGYNQIFIRCQQNYANDLLNSRGHLFLNEVYDMLGLPRTRPGAVVGWLKPDNCQDDCGDGFVDFGVFRGDTYMGQEFVNGNERSILLDFNVDGVVYDKI